MTRLEREVLRGAMDILRPNPKRGRGISLAASNLRTCPVCNRPRGTVRGCFVAHPGKDSKDCPMSGRPAATRSGADGLPEDARRD